MSSKVTPRICAVPQKADSVTTGSDYPTAGFRAIKSACHVYIRDWGGSKDSREVLEAA